MRRPNYARGYVMRVGPQKLCLWSKGLTAHSAALGRLPIFNVFKRRPPHDYHTGNHK